jgi:flagellar basal body-associated protein FliL
MKKRKIILILIIIVIILLALWVFLTADNVIESTDFYR